MYYYVDAYFAGLWGNVKPQDPIFAISITVFLVTLGNFTLLWVSKLQTWIYLSTLNYGWVTLSYYVR